MMTNIKFMKCWVLPTSLMCSILEQTP